MLDETLWKSPRGKAQPTVGSGKPTRPANDELRGQVGRPCIVCRRAVEPVEVEREVTGGSGVVLTAHEECYRPWREESRVWRDLVAIGESAHRSGMTGRGRT